MKEFIYKCLRLFSDYKVRKPHARFDAADTGNGIDDPLEGDTLPKGEKRHVLTRSVPLLDQLPTIL